jgi:hypothetical protein
MKKQVVSNETIPSEIVAEAIMQISRGMAEFRAGKLNEKALVILLAASCGETRGVCKRVLDGLASLESTYLK